MKNIIRQSCYSFFSQHLLLNHPENTDDLFWLYEDGLFDRGTYSFVLNTIIGSTVRGTNLFISKPNGVCLEKRGDRLTEGDGRKGLRLNLPPSFPFDSLNIWFTPRVFIESIGESKKEYHFIHVERLGMNSFHLVYVACERLKTIDWGEPNLEWRILPLSFIMTINDSIMRTPLLPLPSFDRAYNIPLRKAIMDIKSGRESDTNMSFFSLGKRDLSKKLYDNFLKTYMFPGIFMFFFGFLEKFNEGKLVQTSGVTEPINFRGDEIVPPISFKEVKIK